MCIKNISFICYSILVEMEMVLSAMYMIQRYMGICLRGHWLMTQKCFSTRIQLNLTLWYLGLISFLCLSYLRA
uniref:Uncharacterized protein n=1 Tax=Monodelphis domestica TaxID=13616 RepID=A0A5F8HJL2_MONDO